MTGSYASLEDATAIVADHAFFQYERTLQRESNPELIINLPPLPNPLAQLEPPGQPTDVALAGLPLSGPEVSAAGENAVGDGSGQQDGVAGQGSGQKGAGMKDANGGAAEQGNDEGLRALLLRVEYELEQPDSGFHFWGAYAHTNSQVQLLLWLNTRSKLLLQPNKLHDVAEAVAEAVMGSYDCIFQFCGYLLEASHGYRMSCALSSWLVYTCSTAEQLTT